MNSWLKAFLCLAIIGLVYAGYDMLKLYSQLIAIVFALVGIIMVFLFEKINWQLLMRLLRKEREIYSVDEWREKAVAALKRNNPSLFNKGECFEAEILQSIPIGVLYSFVPGLEERKCAFGEVWKDSKNLIISPLDSVEWHLRTNFCKSMKEVGLLYLKKEDVEKISIWKQNKILITKPTVEVV